ncbi:MAG: NADPH-dependent F420 reductase [Chloroflexi bacterium]|nr:NADPH-dependent F420 reductase [Chloroflexota bacterium]
MLLAFVGGTGPEGRGLALRLALVGHEVIIGSREGARAEAAAQELRAKAAGAVITGTENSDAARLASVVFVTVPYEGHKAILQSLREQLRGKIVVDVVAPLAFPKGRPRALPVEEGSAAQQAQQALPESRVVAAFHHISAVDLLVTDRPIECDVLFCSDDQEAKRTVMPLADAIHGARAVDAGGLECARYLEEFTALLLNINRVYKGKRSMLRITGL